MSESKQSINDPLLYCLQELAKTYHSPASTETLKAGLPLVDGLLTPELFVRAATRIGLRAKVIKRKLLDISDMVMPAVLLAKNNQAFLLKEFEKDKRSALVVDAQSGEERAMNISELKKCYSGYAILAAPDLVLENQQRDPAKKWFSSVMFSSWRIYRDVLVASLFINVFAVASPLFVMNVYDRVVPNNAVETLWVLAIGVLIVYGFDAILKYLRGHFIEVAGKKSDVLLSSFLFERVLGSRFSDRPSSIGSFVSQFREFDTVRNFFTSSSIAVFVDLPFVVIFIVLVFYIGGSLALVPLIALPIMWLYGMVLQRPIKKSIEETFEASAHKNGVLVETLVGLDTVKAQVAESYLQKSWEKSVAHLAIWGQRLRMLSMSVSIVTGTVQQVAGVVLIIFGVYMIAEGELTMGALIASFMLTNRLLAPMGQVVSLFTSYDQTKTALDTLDEIVKKPQEREPQKPFVKRPVFEGAISFQNVSLMYPGEKQASLKQINFSIKAGEKVGIIGRIGSGKTSLQNLILGFYQPSEGSVLIDGIDIAQIDPADLRAHMGYVQQDVALFAGSIKDNITFGKPQVSDEQLLAAAKMASVDEFVNRHPSGFDRQVGERGQALSGGQRQSIGIARAVLNDPSILLLDEPTSGMDNSTEAAIKQQLTTVAKDKTLILVTHKTSLLSLVDRLIVIDNGSMVADGNKDTVLEALRSGQLMGAKP